MPDVPRIKVMVVEDDMQVSRAIQRTLSPDTHEVELVDEPQPVLERLGAGAADWEVVILDVGLPGMSGIEVLHRFRQAGGVHLHAASMGLCRVILRIDSARERFDGSKRPISGPKIQIVRMADYPDRQPA